MDWTHLTAPSLDDIGALAEAARAALPDPFRAHAADVALQIADLPDEEMCASLNLEDPFELTGLYDGIPLTEKSVVDQPMQPDMVWLFRLPILAEWADRGSETLGHLVTHVYVHEIAHHFGWSDADIAKIDEWWK